MKKSEDVLKSSEDSSICALPGVGYISCRSAFTNSLDQSHLQHTSQITIGSVIGHIKCFSAPSYFFAQDKSKVKKSLVLRLKKQSFFYCCTICYPHHCKEKRSDTPSEIEFFDFGQFYTTTTEEYQAYMNESHFALN